MIKIQALNLLLNVDDISEVQIRTYNYQSSHHNWLFRFFRTFLKFFEFDFKGSVIDIKVKSTEGFKFKLTYQADDSGILNEQRLKEAHQDYNKLAKNLVDKNGVIECSGVLSNLVNTNKSKSVR